MRNLLDMLDHYFVHSQMCRLFESLFERLEETEPEYKQNPFVCSVIDEISLRLPRLFEQVDANSDLGDKLTKLLVFVTLNIISRGGENVQLKLSKTFDKCSFIGRKVMINLPQNLHKLQAVLKFYVVVITAIEDITVLKGVTRQIILLIYRTYTNPKLNNTEAKNISVEIIEMLQNKYGEDVNEFLNLFSEVKKTIEATKQERKKVEKISAVKNVEAFKRKRDRKHKRKKENDRLKKMILSASR
mmetsp:Transcript_1253/g.1291  ORF Transcript_1253/g.1291 Transcript_1253/m.1291 type:complete len:244 (+) Transcript_1253:2843-3574(+)